MTPHFSDAELGKGVIVIIYSDKYNKKLTGTFLI
jgi:hypothetical protein